MKKLVFGLIATVMFGLNADAKTNLPLDNSTANTITDVSDQTKVDDGKIKLTISIDWGRKSRDCRGFGICAVVVDIDFEIDPIEILFKGTSNDEGRLVLELTSKGLENIKKTFGSDTIVIEEDFRLSDQDCKNLELKAGYTIKAGKYQVKQDAKGVSYVTL